MIDLSLISKALCAAALFSVLTAIPELPQAGTPDEAQASQRARRAAEFPKRTVRYSDLDLKVEADVARLYRRLDRAARTVCDSGHVLALRSPRYRQCREQAIANAVSQINAPVLTAYYNAKHAGAKTAQEKLSSTGG